MELKFKITDFDKINIEAGSATIETSSGEIEILPNHCEIMCSGKLLKYFNGQESVVFEQASEMRIFLFSKNLLQIL